MENDNAKLKITRWKNWPYWVRGGIIGVLLGITVYICNLFPFFYFSDSSILVIKILGMLLSIPVFIASVPAYILSFLLVNLTNYDAAVPFLPISVVIGIYIILGVSLSWIQEKRKHQPNIPSKPN